MFENWPRGKGRLEGVKFFPSFIGKGEVGMMFFLEESCQIHRFLRVVVNELAIEVGKAKEGLETLDGRWFRPVEDTRNLGLVHR